jgi:sec-independent protein translocase protein TatA
MMDIGLGPVVLGLLGPFGAPELIFIVFIIFLLFGAKKVPEIMKSFAQGIREFKRESTRIVSDIESAVDSEPEPRKSSSDSTD